MLKEAKTLSERFVCGEFSGKVLTACGIKDQITDINKHEQTNYAICWLESAPHGSLDDRVFWPVPVHLSKFEFLRNNFLLQKNFLIKFPLPFFSILR